MNRPLDAIEKLDSYAYAIFAEASKYLNSIPKEKLKELKYKPIASEYSSIIGTWLNLGVKIRRWGTGFLPEIIVTKSEFPWANDLLCKRNPVYIYPEEPKDIVTIDSGDISLETEGTYEAIAAAYFLFNNKKAYKNVFDYVMFSLASDDEKNEMLLNSPFFGSDFVYFIANCDVLTRGE